MYPRTKAGAEKYREKKRIVEIGLIIEHIKQSVQNNPGLEVRNLQILEFGSGPGFQVPHLQKLGSVVTSDIYVSDGIKRAPGDVSFTQCSITNTPFADGHFDLLFSNHVIEHIQDLNGAFDEMRRIGKSECIYAFAVPTNIWLLLSLPARYYLKLRKFLGKETQKTEHPGKPDFSDKPVVIRMLDKLRPRGHGAIYDFWACYRAFKIGSWQSLFERNGFVIKEVHPLLLYAASEWPIVPVTEAFNQLDICSSVLFLMQKG